MRTTIARRIGRIAGAEASERLDAVVLFIARLIGRRMAREDYEKAMLAANDNNDPEGETDAQEIIRVLMIIEAGRKRTLRLNSGYLHDI
ncbi:hypothetical protein [Phyllobacterium salinisoli]|uniref:hypothetical protein n=1 Tax=Phyllobacterium salinisoli TaxID=1899321 RepID=UPI0011C01E83|nr:hypothetical protein [Phyllobacterium salinisoli]